eukprot:6770904-Prymnesium_polylepis.2
MTNTHAPHRTSPRTGIDPRPPPRTGIDPRPPPAAAAQSSIQSQHRAACVCRSRRAMPLLHRHGRCARRHPLARHRRNRRSPAPAPREASTIAAAAA